MRHNGGVAKKRTLEPHLMKKYADTLVQHAGKFICDYCLHQANCTLLTQMDILILILLTYSLQAHLTLTISTQHVRAISPSDHHRNIALPPDKINWEIGLKEATYQALLREQIPDPNLREGIYATPIDGYQNSATPFGDIAILARGQLYSTPHGYQFVQDPYQNDCDDCHNTAYRCDRQQCESQTNQNWHNLLALWTVKRIRHRDPKFGHRFELQYTISPMSPAGNAEFVTRNGRFDYTIPGHVFIVKIKSNGATSDFHSERSNYKYLKNYRSNHKTEKSTIWSHNLNNDGYYSPTAKTQTHYQHTPNSILINTENHHLLQNKKVVNEHAYRPGFLIGISPNGYKHIVHDIPEFVSEKHQTIPEETSTKEPIKHYHHHFYIPEVADIDEYQRKTLKPVLPTVFSTTKEQGYITSHASSSPTNIPHNFLTTQHIPSSSTVPKQIFTPETTAVIRPLTTNQDYTYGTTFKYPETTIPITLNPTLFTDFKFPSHTDPSFTNNPTYPKTTLVNFYTVPTPTPTQPTPFQPSPFYIQYSEPDPTYSNNEPPTVSTYVAQTLHPTIQPTTSPFVEISDEQERITPTVHIYEEVTNTEDTTTPTIKTTKPIKYPDSINVQLPPPEKGTDTTIPYVASTGVTIIATPTSVPTLHETELITTEKDNHQSDSTKIKTTTELETEPTTADKDYEDHIETNPTTIKIFSTEIIPNNHTSIFEEQLTDTLTSPFTKVITTTEDTFTQKTEQSETTFTPIHTTKAIIKTTPMYSQDFDIFGDTKKFKNNTTEMLKTTKLIPLTSKPNAFDEIFSDFKTSTEMQKKLTPRTTQPLNSHTSRNARLSKYLKYKRNKSNRLSSSNSNRNNEKPKDTTDNLNDSNDIETKTSQSFITSISFKVNKNVDNDEPTTNNPHATKTSAYEIGSATAFNRNQEKRAEDLINISTSEKSQTFHDIAQSLINHARVATYLKEKPTQPTKHKQNYKLQN